MKKRLAVLISNVGTGTNLQAIINAIEADKMNAAISIVVSDTDKAFGLERARQHNIPFEIVPEKERILGALKEYNIDFVCLAGWKQIITDEVIKFYENKILNIHPGLIPDKMDIFVKNPDGSKGLWNRGKLTVKAMRGFLDSKASYSGSTVHFLSNEFDFGKVLGRCFEKIRKNDSVESLYERLKKKENSLYVKSLIRLCR